MHGAASLLKWSEPYMWARRTVISVGGVAGAVAIALGGGDALTRPVPVEARRGGAHSSRTSNPNPNPVILTLTP